LQSLQDIMGQLKSFDSRITSMEEVSTAPAPAAAPAPAVVPVPEPAAKESVTPISALLAKLGKSS
jgi:hypothetical protein